MAGRRRGRYPPEYKERIVELVRAGRSPGSLAREFEPSQQTIRNWVKQADLDEGDILDDHGSLSGRQWSHGPHARTAFHVAARADSPAGLLRQ